MQPWNRTLFVLMGLAVVLGLGFQFSSAQQNDRPIEKWEYRVIELGPAHPDAEIEWTKTMNVMAEKGWEVIGTSFSTMNGNTKDFYVSMKRLKH